MKKKRVYKTTHTTPLFLGSERDHTTMSQRNLSAAEILRKQLDQLQKNPEKAIKDVDIKERKRKKELSPPPEFVMNVKGSSAGAGSGEFHVYKEARRKEFERIKMFEEERKKEEEELDFGRRKSEAQKKDEARTERNRLKRNKRKKKRSSEKEESETTTEKGKQEEELLRERELKKPKLMEESEFKIIESSL